MDDAGELAELRKKGERDFFEFDLPKPKKNEMTRVADIQLQLRKTDPKKAKYDVLIQVDDSKLEKKDRTANEPVQFLVGRDKLRYELVVNFVDKKILDESHLSCQACCGGRGGFSERNPRTRVRSGGRPR